MQKLLPLDAALKRINDLEATTRAETVAISADIAGRFLAEDISAQHDVPPFQNSAVDGFALPQAAPKGTTFQITQYLPAGTEAVPLQAGTAAQVFTGGAIPANTATIIMREETKIDGTQIHTQCTAKAGAHIRAQGEDFARDAVMFRAGERLDARHIAAFAVAGVTEISVTQPLRIGIFSAGNEVQDFGTDLKKGRIHDGNRPALISLLQRFGAVVTDLGIVPDDQKKLETFITEHCTSFDLLVASAGMSESATDHTAQTMKHLGKTIFWQLAIKPARPVGLAQFRSQNNLCYVLGLPGNPASCLLAAWLVGLPLLRRLSGGVAQLPRGYYVVAGFTLRKKPHRREFIRVRLDADNIAHRILPSGSATLSSFAAADGVLDLPEEQDTLELGDQVLYRPFTDL